MDLPDLGSYKQSLFPLSPRPSDGHLPISLFGQSPFPCLEFSRCAVCSLSGKFSEVSFTLSLCHPLPVAHFPRVATLWRWESKQSMGKRMRGASRARVQGRVGREPTCHAGESKKKCGTWGLGSWFLALFALYGNNRESFKCCSKKLWLGQGCAFCFGCLLCLGG